VTRQPTFLFIEPFYGGSHRDFADGLVTHSRHRIDLVTLPDRFWKWRMRGAAIYLANRIANPARYNGLLLSSLMNLADLKALWGTQCPPALVYFHENQLTYPSQGDTPTDYQPGFTNIITALTARKNLFNSRMQMEAFLASAAKLIRTMPDCRPKWSLSEISNKSDVAYPGCHFSANGGPLRKRPSRPPLIIWNHRWEHDKNPEMFFWALDRMLHRGIDFQVALLGEAYPKRPQVFDRARGKLGKRIIQFGRVPSRKTYYDWLSRGAIVISTARQENFGIAVVEAMRHGCLPLLPRRLSYPEILPDRFHDDFLYTGRADMEEKLADLLNRPEAYTAKAAALAAAMGAFAWEKAIDRFDDALQTLITQPIERSTKR
jgi:glycosyltransferase involved in cell wall biosynthesis